MRFDGPEGSVLKSDKELQDQVLLHRSSTKPQVCDIISKVPATIKFLYTAYTYVGQRAGK